MHFFSIWLDFTLSLVIKDVNEACVMMFKDEKFLNDDFIDKFVLNDLIDDSEDDKKNVEFINDCYILTGDSSGIGARG